MKIKRRQREWLILPLCIFFFAALLTGCKQKAEAEPETKTTLDKNIGETRKEDIDGHDTDNSPKRLSEEELAALEYVEKIEIEDLLYETKAYAYAPVGTEIYEEGYCLYDEHGLIYNVSAWVMEDIDTKEDILQYSVDIDMEYGWQFDFESEFSDHENIQISEIMENGEDRYVIATSEESNMEGTAVSECKKIYYLEVQNDSVAVIWQLEMSEWDTDEETELILADMEKCYGIDLDPIRPSGSYFAQQEAYHEQYQDEYVPMEGHNVLAKVNGYQYLGLGTLAYYNNEAECPVMVPMGHDVWFEDDTYVSSTLHGVDVSARIIILGRDFNTDVPSYIQDKQDFYQSYAEFHNVVVSDAIPLTDYDAALYMTIELDRDGYDGETLHRVNVFSYILIKEGYALEYDIELRPEQFDNSTDTLLKELEDAYGFDLSDYYYKRKK